MKRTFCLMAALVCALTLFSVPALCEEVIETEDTIFTIVTAPEQTAAQRPPCFPDPTADYIPLPDTENIAQGKPVLSGAHTDVYVSSNVNDGKTDTYWESKGWPAEMTNISCPLPSRVHVLGSWCISLKYSAVITSVMPSEPPGWPDFAAPTILMMSRRTCEAVFFNVSILAIVT